MEKITKLKDISIPYYHVCDRFKTDNSSMDNWQNIPKKLLKILNSIGK